MCVFVDRTAFVLCVFETPLPWLHSQMCFFQHRRICSQSDVTLISNMSGIRFIRALRGAELISLAFAKFQTSQQRSDATLRPHGAAPPLSLLLRTSGCERRLAIWSGHLGCERTRRRASDPHQ